MRGDGDDIAQRCEHTEAMTPRQVDDDLSGVHVRCQGLDHLGQSIVGYAEHEQVARTSDVDGPGYRHTRQERLGAHPRDVSARGAGHDIVTGPAQGRPDHGTGAPGADDTDAQSRGRAHHVGSVDAGVRAQAYASQRSQATPPSRAGSRSLSAAK